MAIENLLLQGSLFIVLPLALFPLWKSLIFGFILRLFFGIGICMLQFGAQTWITSISPPNKRGRNIALFGLSFELGFGIGPMMTRFLEVNEALPFFLTAGIGLFACLTIFWLKNEQPGQIKQTGSFYNILKRFSQAWKFAWVSFFLINHFSRYIKLKLYIYRNSFHLMYIENYKTRFPIN